jgi:hypothetical protein
MLGILLYLENYTERTVSDSRAEVQVLQKGQESLMRCIDKD